MEIKISKDFSETPGGRKREDGPHSGEEFREDLLIPNYIKAKKQNEELIINLDGGYGYPTSFLEEAFGGLARIYDKKDVLSIIKFISNDEPPLIDEIKQYIKEANKEGNNYGK